mmetsp:Transcript_26178/g.39634  ORF Transcript_26178/g.39634 Transcript_26178/m.39634 type:complete len:314 (+) Transcript_26178:294-1235(+)|eukprot:CAMPEP_0178902538 /NCGR_PEP_ID=MMETSP0786-20121207/4661_1 /TAXON_ID=186022 /ORGANISM="Thalassionema frauenfeldii, Strain CCMP 1798" /LENGTH=313 /DNA_ID=CAMNT_0020573817 /DNA_START=231 /DNA_END=1172 /DNA_ORIENTATION=-
MPPYGTPPDMYRKPLVREGSMQSRPSHVPLRTKNNAKTVLRKSSGTNNNNVSWGVVNIRKYDVGLGHSPCCEIPLTLLETHTQFPAQSLDEYESTRRYKRRHRKQLRIPLSERRRILIEKGVSLDEINYVTRSLYPIRQQIMSDLASYKGFKNRSPQFFARELAEELLSKEEFESYTHFPPPPPLKVATEVKTGGNFNSFRTVQLKNFDNANDKKTTTNTRNGYGARTNGVKKAATTNNNPNSNRYGSYGAKSGSSVYGTRTLPKATSSYAAQKQSSIKKTNGSNHSFYQAVEGAAKSTVVSSGSSSDEEMEC